MTCTRRAFSLIELLVVISIIALLISLLLPAVGKARTLAWQAKSLANIHQILIGNEAYRRDYKDYYPIIESYHSPRYAPPLSVSFIALHKVSGWCTWSGWGKNNDGAWRGSSTAGNPFDWEAADRQGNPYISDDPRALQAPSASSMNMLNADAWQRKLEQFIYRDPSDQESYLRTSQKMGGTSNFDKLPDVVAMSAYNDVGTSYLWNDKWWFDPVFQTHRITTPFYNSQVELGPTFAVGTRELALGNSFNPSRMVLVNDQYAQVVPLNTSNPYLRIRNGYGDLNKSMLGFIDGHTAYLPVYSGADTSVNAMRTEKYSFIFESMKPRGQ